MAYQNDPAIVAKAQKYIDAALAMGATDSYYQKMLALAVEE